ncbi:MAG TPA: hypothetical protein VJX29_14890 [Candidatus Acidoferrales bacterium]|nr:hypothetical protein [Candidatus Acidoferrales bacterium]
MRNTSFGLLLAGALCAAGWWSAAAAQDMTTTGAQEPSVAEAARKAKAEKKTEAVPQHVWTDDNIPKVPREVPAATGEAGEEGAAEAGAAAPAGTKAAAAEDDAKKQADLEAKWRQKFADAQKKLDDDQKDLDLTQREYNLKREQYYSDPNTAMREQYQYPGQKGGEVNDTAKKIDDLKQKIEQDKQAISNLEDQLRKEGLPPGWARP